MKLLHEVPDLRAKPMREIIYEHLKKAIVCGELTADSTFTDAEIAEEFGVSRTPAREALQKLESNGYIEHVPMRGNRVCGVSPNELAYSFAIRKALETLAIRYAALRITDSELAKIAAILGQIDQVKDSLLGDKLEDALFPLIKQYNEAVFAACKSKRIQESIWAQREIFDRYGVMREVLSNRIEKSIHRRHELYDALAAHDPEKANAIWTDHLNESFEMWRQQSGYAEELKDFIFL